MQWVGVPELAAAVASAGAVGMLTALTQPSPEALREAIRKTKSLTNGRFVRQLQMTTLTSGREYHSAAKHHPPRLVSY